MPENLIISGHRIPSSTGETFNVIEPATGKVLAEVAKGPPWSAEFDPCDIRAQMMDGKP